jgi:FKBP-type peptidyl-prolyl cis-trans isomerase
MRKAILLLAMLLSIAATHAADEKIRGVLEKTDKPGACAQVTDALGDTYYIAQTSETEKLIADFVGKNIKVVVTGTVETKDGKPPANFVSLKSVEKYLPKLPPAPAAAAESKTDAPADKGKTAGAAAEGSETMAENNKAAGEAFLAENKKKEGVVTTASGLQYKILKEGAGEKPGPTSKVNVHYRGTTIDGKEFDSSYQRGKPISFPLNGVIKGWTEGVQLMPVGAKFQFFIPSELAYGKRGSPPSIGPDATLIFEVELLAIEK